jgi:hypothetical protein
MLGFGLVSMSCGLDKNDSQNVVVFDLAGGPFDVSLLSIEDNFVEVLEIAGDIHIGRKDFDNRIVEHFFDIFEISKRQTTLKRESEKTKRVPSMRHPPFTCSPIENLVLNTMESVQQVLIDAAACNRCFQLKNRLLTVLLSKGKSSPTIKNIRRMQSSTESFSPPLGFTPFIKGNVHHFRRFLSLHHLPRL